MIKEIFWWTSFQQILRICKPNGKSKISWGELIHLRINRQSSFQINNYFHAILKYKRLESRKDKWRLYEKNCGFKIKCLIFRLLNYKGSSLEWKT